MDQAKEQHMKELEGLMSEYKSHIRALETEVQELPKLPMVDQGSGLQALREELANEKHVVQEAPCVIFSVSARIEEGSIAESQGKDRAARADTLRAPRRDQCRTTRHVQRTRR
jgi:hypothetical protein